MNYLITESQLKIIVNEQKSDYAVDRQSNAIMNASGIRSKEDYNTVNTVTKKAMEGATVPLDDHTVMTILQIGSSFIPYIGPLLSTGLGLADAALYYKKGDTKTAGLVALFASIPGIGGLASKLGLAKWTSKALGELGKKISNGSKLLPQEIQAAKVVAKNQNLILNGIKQVAITVGKTATTVGGYVAAGGAYSKAYDVAQKNTPKVKAESEGLNWEFVKSAFGSSGTAQDNTLLNQAWTKGWRPGKIVPQNLQTAVYKDNYNTEIENIKTLNSIVSNTTA